ncbi:PorP/SprF family type IX secretion system membrane protein [Owenweeksia hongkongensis]|uniref:PorP/SprF family type IX secretion system membrane protein n=1 Tax=Owenweeksia hongkongensis TaxID=253245 RepID=UPI003A8E8D89
MVQLHLYAKGWLTLMLFCCAMLMQAQDPVFSQFNLNKNYLNPAYAGYSGDLSIGVNSRMQWNNIPGKFSTNTFNANIGCGAGRFGLALTGYDHVEGEGYLHSQNAAVQMSVNLPGKLGRMFGRKLRRQKYIMSGGISVGVGQKTLDWDKLTFSDQYSAYQGFSGQPSAAHGYSEASNTIFDLSAGLRMQAEINRKGSYVSFGGAIFHLNKPVETFYDSDNRLPPRYTFHFFTYLQTKKFTNKPNFLSVGMISDNQQNLRTNTFMMAKDVQHWGKVSMGFRRQNFLLVDRNVDAVILQGLVSFGGLTLGYSYDITISKLGPHNTFGTHEIGIAYNFSGFGLCGGGKKGKGKKSADNCFMLMDNVDSNFKDLYLWNP